MTQARDAAFVAGCFAAQFVGLLGLLYAFGGWMILPPSVLLGI